ncbi:hypothetical protein ACHAWC_003088 [Mediolabrus comicus]
MPDDNFRIGYVADVEGHWDYFLEYVQRSQVLDWEDHEEHNNILSTPASNNKSIKFQRLKLRPNTHFVYGGDAVDKGPGDIRLCRALVNLKKRYPDNVHLLVGNRDLNKLRFSSELSDDDMRRPLEDIKRPFWDPKAKSYKEHLEEIIQSDATNSGDCTLDQLNTKVERLRWMLKHTLGCPETFEFRREEVAILEQIYGSYPPNFSESHDSSPIHSFPFNSDATKVTDENVVNSFEYEINHPEGSLRQYLHHASIAAIVGNTIFVHGAIDRLTMRFVPAKESKFELPTSPPPSFTEPSIVNIKDGTMIEDVHEWVKSLNAYLHDGLKDFESRPVWNPERTSRGGESLLAIQNRPSMWGRSVVCNSYADGGVVATDDAEEERKQALKIAQEECNPLAFEGIASNVFDPIPAEWLLKHGIRRIVVGHKPTGDCPAVLSPAYTGVEVCAVDTSFARRSDISTDKMRDRFGKNRGDAMSGHKPTGDCPAVLSPAYTGVEVCAVDTSFARRSDISTDKMRDRFGKNRGDAMSVVEIAGSDPHNNCLEVFGTLADGREYFSKHPHIGGNIGAETGDPKLGKKTSDGWWIKASAAGHYHVSRGSGRNVEYDTRSEEEVTRLMDPVKTIKRRVN